MNNKLKIENFQEKVDLVKKEHIVLDYWKETHAFERSVSERDPKKRYVFYDGPPFATGLPHYGHILTSVIKDAIPRYWTMKGYRVDRVWGWDCHGIPIENMIEKELGLKGGKKAIEELGIDKFNASCRAAILRFDTEWEKVVERIGRWVDFKHSYKTMDLTFMESVWWAFKTLQEKGFVYEGRRVILYCPRCATPLSNFEIAMDNSYRNLPGPSTTYKYKVVNEPDTYFLAWSTTPWNKLATPALAVNPDLEYVKVKQGKEFYILAYNTLKMLKSEPYEVIEVYKGSQLEQFTFEMHYIFYEPKPGEKTGVVIADSFVSDAEGTGIVTLAVYGEDDYRVMLSHGVQLIEHVDSEGKLKPEVTPWAGMFMLKVNSLVNEDLSKRGLVYHTEERIHSVPVCYRCETRLYQAPIPAWFINVQKLKPDLLKANEKINWYPDYLKHGRFGKGLETAPDWNISRSRYWGTPMPVWQAASGKGKAESMRIIGSLEELKTWAVNPKEVERLTDIHREFIDQIEVWIDDAKTIKGRRIPEVFDCWVESGSMPYASLHYPFERKELFDKTHPAQFIVEYISQTRAWFYTLHVMSVGLFGKHTFENALTHGVILAQDGAKMSKSKKNYPDPTILFEKYGVDALRFYLAGAVVMKAENLNFSEAAVKETYQKVISLLWNTTCFYKLYSGAGQVVKELEPHLITHTLDTWILSKTMRLIKDVSESMDHYDTITSCRKIQGFIDDLSTWYLRRSRDRFKKDIHAMQIFGWVLNQLVLVMAPLTPFISELIYQNITASKDSVHLVSWPTSDASMINDDLESQMDFVRKIVEALHSIRKEQNLAVKQPLLSWSFEMKDKKIFTKNLSILDLVNEEVNVKLLVPHEKLKSKKGLKTAVVACAGQDVTVYLDIEVTPELLKERQVRELIREIQKLRKEKACALDQKIVLTLPMTFKSLPDALVSTITKEVLASKITWGNNLDISIGQS
jgi:isoleucyl-tRNA synthetase